MEIRRIEGVLPVEGINRDLPIKLENFSRRDMEKLLSLIEKGESKGNLGSEFETLLKATFLEYVGENRGKIKIGNSVVNAEIKTDRSFEPGEELLLKLKSVGDKIEFSIVSPVRKKLLTFLKGKLGEFLKGNLELRMLTEEELTLISKVLKEKYPELVPAFKAFSQNKSPFSPYFLLSLLLLAKDDVRSKLKIRKTKEEVVRQIENLLSLYSFYVFSGILSLPVSLGKGFEGEVFYHKGDVPKAFVKVDTKEGKFRALLSLVGNKVSLEYWTDGNLKEKVKDEGLKECLLRVGLEPVFIRKFEIKDEEILLDWLKSKGLNLDVVT